MKSRAHRPTPPSLAAVVDAGWARSTETRWSRACPWCFRVTHSSDAQQKAAQAAVFVGDKIRESARSPFESPFNINLLALNTRARNRPDRVAPSVRGSGTRPIPDRPLGTRDRRREHVETDKSRPYRALICSQSVSPPRECCLAALRVLHRARVERPADGRAGEGLWERRPPRPPLRRRRCPGGWTSAVRLVIDVKRLGA
jgi:hypothetical protein